MTRRTPSQYDWANCLFDDTRLGISSGTGIRHYTSPRRDQIRFIVAHHMTIIGDGTGKALNGCWNTWQNRQASAHYGVEENLVRQYVSDNDAAWACANTYGNHAGISIEHANSTGASAWKVSDTTWKTGARLAAHLHKLYDLGRPVKNVTLRRHHDFYATACPGPYLDTIWSQYVAEAQRVYDSIGAPKPVPASDPVPAPEPTPTPTPAPVGPAVETISANLAGYDKVYGMRTRVSRAKSTIPTYFAAKRPTWLHFQECAIDMWPELDKKLTEYTRVPAGGKGRESYYRKDAGIRIIEAWLLNVEHMLLKDTKEHLVIAWEKDGYEAVDVNFHNENEGSTYQSVQLRDVMNHAREMADKHGIPRANILVTGDSNTKAAAYLARLWGWTEAIYKAAKKIDLQYHSTNGWRTWNAGGLTAGRRIDVDITQRSAVVLEAEQLFGALTGDHWAHRVLRRLVK